MKPFVKIAFIITALGALFISCSDDDADKQTFGPDIETISVGPEGGNKTFRLYAEGDWVASSSSPWILVSPMNGNKTTECTIKIDSTVMYESRSSKVVFTMSGVKKEIPVQQLGFAPVIAIEDNSQKLIEIPDYEPIESSNFSIDVTSNIDYLVEFVDEDSQPIDWIELRKGTKLPEASYKAKPRTTTLHFDWLTNVEPEQQKAFIQFKPKEDITVEQIDKVEVVQDAAPLIVPSRHGDSLTLVTLSRIMNFDQKFPTNLPMDQWDEVELNSEGRVIKANLGFFLWAYSKVLFPYHIKYLTELEELYVWGGYGIYNEYPQLNDIITELKKLRVLKVQACFIGEVAPEITELENLEVLDLGFNCLQEIPDFITPENFPKLKELAFNTNTRGAAVMDLQNVNNYEGLGLKGALPERLFLWDNLDTLKLGVNHYDGRIPSFEGRADIPKWGEGEFAAEDAEFIAENPALLGVPRILPNCKFLSLNLNRLTGELPRWILEHPYLCKWIPYTFIFTQEGKDRNGNIARFDNVPSKLDCFDEDED